MDCGCAEQAGLRRPAITLRRTVERGETLRGWFLSGFNLGNQPGLGDEAAARARGRDDKQHTPEIHARSPTRFVRGNEAKNSSGLNYGLRRTPDWLGNEKPPPPLISGGGVSLGDG